LVPARKDIAVTGGDLKPPRPPRSPRRPAGARRGCSPAWRSPAPQPAMAFPWPPGGLSLS